MATLGTADKKFVSAIDGMFDTREIGDGLIDINNDTYLTDILYLANRIKPTEQPIYYDFFAETIFKQVDTAGATITNNGTPTITITGATTITSGYNRAGDVLIRQGASNDRFYVKSVTTVAGKDTLIVQTAGGGNGTITAGDVFNSFTRGVGEASGSPVNLRFGAFKDFNKTQLFREISQITDIQKASAIEVSINGQKSYVMYDHVQKFIRLKGQINAAFIGGDISVTSFSDVTPVLVDTNTPSTGGGGGAVQLTRGLDKYITSVGGNALSVATPGVLAGADLKAGYAMLTSRRAGTKYIVYGGKAALGISDTYWKGLGSSGLQSVRMVIGGKDVNTTVQTVTDGGYDMEFVLLPILDQPDLFGNTDIAKSLYFVPKDGFVKTVGGGSEPALQVRYQPKYGNTQVNNNGLISEINSGALNPINPNGTIAEIRTEWISEQGLQCLGVQHMMRLKVA